jgi:hypothetical protein
MIRRNESGTGESAIVNLGRDATVRLNGMERACGQRQTGAVVGCNEERPSTYGEMDDGRLHESSDLKLFHHSLSALQSISLCSQSVGQMQD